MTYSGYTPTPRKICNRPDCDNANDGRKSPVCYHCQIAEKNNPSADERGAVVFEISQLAGRCANGFEGGHGVLFHARIVAEYEYIPGEFGASNTALCGAKPGKRSAGWSSYQPAGRVVTCKRCLKKVEKLERN